MCVCTWPRGDVDSWSIPIGQRTWELKTFLHHFFQNVNYKLIIDIYAYMHTYMHFDWYKRTKVYILHFRALTVDGFGTCRVMDGRKLIRIYSYRQKRAIIWMHSKSLWPHHLGVYYSHIFFFTFHAPFINFYPLIFFNSSDLTAENKKMCERSKKRCVNITSLYIYI